MSILPRDTSEKDTVTRSQARKNPILAKEIEETSQGPPKAKRKSQENTAKDSQHSETSNALNQSDLLSISIGNMPDLEISTQNKSIIKTKHPGSIF